VLKRKDLHVPACFGEIINAAEDLGWVDNYPDGITEEWKDMDGTHATEDAIEYIIEKGYRIVWCGDGNIPMDQVLTPEEVEECGYECACVYPEEVSDE